MKTIAIIALAGFLTVGSAFASEPTAADQKWLTAVEKMVADGQTKISTPSKDRVSLLEKWAEKRGYSVQVTKNDTVYRVELSKALSGK